jgi:acetyltransferase
VPAYDTPHQAVGGFMHLVRWQRRRAALMETPPAVAGGARPDFAGARALLAGVLGEGRSMLGEPEAKRVLALCGVPVVEAVTAATPGEAGAAAAKLGSPLVLKILSRDLSHKSDVGGVRLNLAGPQEVEAAARDMLDAVAALRPGARIDGFSVQRMARMDNPHELIAGIATDAVFGPTILFGKGGVEVEVTNDSAVSLPPLNQVLAKEQMRRTRVWRLLQGYRNRKAADMDAVAATLVRLAEMAHELPEIAELDINPLWADPSGVLALDARIRVQPADAAVPFAIRPYPTALESKMTLDDGSILTVRPIRPEDEAALRTLVERSSPADIRRRFFASVKTLGHETAARLTQIDYDREMALVACEGEEVIGVVRMTADPEHEAAEFAAFVRTDRQGRGLGRRLMARLIDYATSRGLDRLVGLVQYGNDAMRGLCRALGFTELPVAEDATLVEVTLRLAGQVPAGGKP